LHSPKPYVDREWTFKKLKTAEAILHNICLRNVDTKFSYLSIANREEYNNYCQETSDAELLYFKN